jgi:TIR domain
MLACGNLEHCLLLVYTSNKLLRRFCLGASNGVVPRLALILALCFCWLFAAVTSGYALTPAQKEKIDQEISLLCKTFPESCKAIPDLLEKGIEVLSKDTPELVVWLIVAGALAGVAGVASKVYRAKMIRKGSDILIAEQRRPIAANTALNEQLSAIDMEGFIARREPVALEPIQDTVECSVFGPSAAPPGQTVLIQVFFHLLEQAERASFLASAMDSSAISKGTRSLETAIRHGGRIEISFSVNALVVDEPVQSVVWQGQPVFCQFLVTIPQGTSGQSFFPVVRVSVDGRLVGCIKFRISSDPSAASPKSEPLGDHACRYNKYTFVSYETKDRKEVLKRVQIMEIMKTPFFMDLLSMDPGDRWKKKLYKKIGDCDLFLLFWSQAAKESKWVIKEAKYALKRQNQNPDSELDIVPVILEQNVLPPPSLAALHFNDRIGYLISLMPKDACDSSSFSGE